MLFNSAAFLAFYALFFPLYWMVHKNLKVRNALILLASYFFYGSWDWRFLSLIMLSTAVDYVCGLRMHAAEDQRSRRFFLGVSLFVNLGVLATFKYMDFFVTEFVAMLTGLGVNINYTTLNIVLPVGISFYTFQTLSYTIDIYYKRLEPTRNLLNFATFVAFFPQLVAGPIERARALLPQIERHTKFSMVDLREGMFLIIWGLFKKTVIADRLAVYVDAVFADPSAATGPQSTIALIFFAIQIYCDFSGYSDIARGVARTLGIRLMVNFNTPYFSTSIKEFWNRWHISLSTWFRDYVFIPLGGSRTTELKLKRNLLITFGVSGLWHGANYTFIIWGLLNAVGYFLDPFAKRGFSENSVVLRTIQLAVGWVITMTIINLSWAFFRADSVGDALIILSNVGMMGAELLSGVSYAYSDIVIAMNKTEFAMSLYLIGLLMFADAFIKDRGIEELTTNFANPMLRSAMSWVLAAHVLLLAPADTGAFIYFQF